MATKSSKLSYKVCSLCPRECGINRSAGEKGFCGAGALAKVSSYAPHHGEEPMISGSKGSGTIFFSHCTMACSFCQNWQISHEGLGNEASDGTLAKMMLELQSKGCHNINLVSPTQYLPNIVEALSEAKEKGLHVPIVYNSNGYEKVETLKALKGIIDIYLPDIKYSDDVAGLNLSNTPDYSKFNRPSIIEMFRQVGNLELDDKGIAVKGLLVRHLVLPNDLAGSKASFEFLADDVSKDVTVGVMAQYHPCFKAAGDPELGRRLTRSEYSRAVRWAKEAGLRNILTQELESSDVFLPDFERADPFK